MSTERTVRLRAADPRHGATLDELAKFVAEAQREGVGPTARLRVTTNWRGGAREIEVTDETPPATHAP
jgi:hypothetical protein